MATEIVSEHVTFSVGLRCFVSLLGEPLRRLRINFRSASRAIRLYAGLAVALLEISLTPRFTEVLMRGCQTE
jgi:hypothetical protein